MRTIHKIPIPYSGDCFTEMMPKNAVFLSLQSQHDSPMMWFEVHSERETEARHFQFFGTGHPIPDDFKGDFLGTFQLGGGALIFHLYAISTVQVLAA